METKKNRKNIYLECRNDRVDGLKGKVSIQRDRKKITFGYDGKYSQGYDGCGTHTHDW